MYVRVLADDGHLSQYSKTNFRIWGIKAMCPFAGRDDSDARINGRIAVELAAMVDGSEERGKRTRMCEVSNSEG